MVKIVAVSQLSCDEESQLVNVIQTSSAWRQTADQIELHLLVKLMLNKVGRSVQKFKKNMTGNDWVSLLLKRH